MLFRSGLESKELLAKLQEVGEFVRSASSTVEAPVLRKLMDKFPDLKPADSGEKPSAKKAPAKKAAAKKSAAVPTKEEIEAALAQLPESAREQIVKQQTNPENETRNIPQVPGVPKPPVNPNLGNAMPRPPRSGNNPFGTSS